MRIAVLAEQNFNLVDGSTVWLLNTCKLLALEPGFDIDLLLSHRLETRVLADDLPAAVCVVEAPDLLAAAGLAETRIGPDSVVDVLGAREAASGRYARILVRGEQYLARLLAEPGLRNRIVAHAAGTVPDLARPDPAWIGPARAARAPILVQSRTAARAMESLCDYPASLIHVLPPAVFAPADRPVERHGPVRLCYAGKIDAEYGLDWLIDLGESLAGEGGAESDPDSGPELDLIAGKDAYRPRHPAFFRRMDGFRAAIAEGRLPGVTLTTNLSPGRALMRMGRADFGYCLRDARYDDVIEISTKAVEFCAVGVPPILGDTALNRDLFGADYPYLVDAGAGDPGPRLRAILTAGRDHADHAAARARIAQVAQGFAAPVLAPLLGRAVRGWPTDAPVLTARPRRILIATHRRKFLDRLVDRLRGDPQVALTWQHWAGMDRPGEIRPTVPGDVDTVFCEWCCENAVWHSRNKRPDTRLIVRLHRFEAFQDFPARVAWDKVDALIVVSDWFRDLMADRHGIDPARIHVLPQYVDWHALRRPKLPEARFTVGMVGITPFEHKRFDRAVDFLAALRARDPRFTLAVRGTMPWQIGWLWDREDGTRAHYEAVFRRILGDPGLAAAIRFDPAGPDMEEWYRGIGAIVSSSDSEGCHTAVLEAMASGCYPLVHDWPGARGLYGDYVHDDLGAAIPGLIGFADDPGIEAARAALSARVKDHDIEAFARAFLAI
jgi:glycosyltransferase involved in cell wall biosynthesis